MGLFGSKPSQFSDPSLGVLTESRTGWNGEVTLGDHSALVTLSGKPGTSAFASARDAVVNVQSQFSSLIPAIKRAVFQLWQPGIATPMWDEDRWPRTEDALWAMLEVSNVLASPNDVELICAFSGDIWPDAMFVLRVDGSRVTPVSLDD